MQQRQGCRAAYGGSGSASQCTTAAMPGPILRPQSIQLPAQIQRLIAGRSITGIVGGLPHLIAASVGFGKRHANLSQCMVNVQGLAASRTSSDSLTAARRARFRRHRTRAVATDEVTKGCWRAEFCMHCVTAEMWSIPCDRRCRIAKLLSAQTDLNTAQKPVHHAGGACGECGGGGRKPDGL